VTMLELKALNNKICGYRDCHTESKIRLYFQLGFSALFCKKCAATLLNSNLARRTTGESATGESATGESATGESATGESATGEASRNEKNFLNIDVTNKKLAIDKAVEPASIATGPSISEDSNEGLLIENKSAVGTNHSSTDKPVPQPVTSSGDQKSRVFSREN
jgi:hypothetical protein